jgi:hypothetical protein
LSQRYRKLPISAVGYGMVSTLIALPDHDHPSFLFFKAGGRDQTQRKKSLRRNRKMTVQRQYYVELRNSSGTTVGTQVFAYSDFDAMRLARERYPDYTPLFARLC